MLPELHRLDQRDRREGVVGGVPPYGDEGAARSRHACDDRAELGLEELPLELDGREDAEETETKADSSTTVLGVRWCA